MMIMEMKDVFLVQEGKEHIFIMQQLDIELIIKLVHQMKIYFFL